MSWLTGLRQCWHLRLWFWPRARSL